MSYLRNQLQSNSKLNQERDYLPEQSFNLPNLGHYTHDQVWDFLRSFDLTPRSISQNLPSHYKTILTYLSTLS